MHALTVHLPPAEVTEACARLLDILKPAGLLYLSWRVAQGGSARDAAGRLYAAFDAARVRDGLGVADILLDAEAVDLVRQDSAPYGGPAALIRGGRRRLSDSRSACRSQRLSMQQRRVKSQTVKATTSPANRQLRLNLGYAAHSDRACRFCYRLAPETKRCRQDRYGFRRRMTKA